MPNGRAKTKKSLRSFKNKLAQQDSEHSSDLLSGLVGIAVKERTQK